MISTLDIAWAAGFLEGEGSFLKRPHHQLRISVGQVQRQPLERLQSLLGGTIYLKKTKSKYQVQDQYTWLRGGTVAAGLMMALYSLMSPRRRQQICQALENWRSGAPHYRYHVRCRNGHPFSRQTRVQRICDICRRTNDRRRRTRLRLVAVLLAAA